MTVKRQLHKFGGSSLADAQCYLRVIQILQEHSHEQDLVIVSAAGKTTNQLILWRQTLSKDLEQANQLLQDLYHFQSGLIAELIQDQTQREALLETLNDEIQTLSKMDAFEAERLNCQVLGHGELWSSRLLSAALNQHQMAARPLDSRQFLRAEKSVLPEIDDVQSLPLLLKFLANQGAYRLVITGFMAQDSRGETVLLGRNGSDYSATMIGALAEVDRVVIWSDVAGVYSADPRKVSDACLLPLLRLDEASELARLAAPVLHTRTLQPIAQSHVDLSLRCSHHPELGSTRIERVLASGRGAKIVTSHDDVLIIQLRFTQEKDFFTQQIEVENFLHQVNLPPLAIEIQAEQHQICFAYTREIAYEVLVHLKHLLPQAVLDLQEGYVMIAAVGAGIVDNSEHRYNFYQKLKYAPVEFITEASSGLSLVAILKKTETTPLLQVIHQRLFQAQKRIAIVLCGLGRQARSWLHLFHRQKSALEHRFGMSFELVALVDRQDYWFDCKGLDPLSAIESFDACCLPHQDLSWLEVIATQDEFDEVVVMDVTTSEHLAQSYHQIAEHGIHLICANKLAGSGPGENYLQLQDIFKKTGRYWLYNATVGAGLPVNYAVRDLQLSGDKITAISGIFSGSLSWLFQQFDGSVPFHELLDAAWQQGLTEVDPRADLDGSDVKRKLIILARECGLHIEPEQVKVESLVPQALIDLSLDDFWDMAEQINESLSERLAKAQSQDKVLRYVARLSPQGEATVEVEALTPEHPLANLLPCDNIFAIESLWYKDNPLVIKGPGAGQEVIAGALQSDLNRLAGLL